MINHEPNKDIKVLKPQILDIIVTMNTRRIDYTMPINHYNITKKLINRGACAVEG